MKSLRKMLMEVKEKIYIYGAGEYGQSCKKIMDYLNIPIEAFLVTDINALPEGMCKDEVDDIPIIQYNPSAMSFIQGGIIIALSRHWHFEVSSLIKGTPYMFFEKPQFSMVEITTKIGCGIACKYCPQKTLINAYTQKSNDIYLKMKDFIQILKHIPPLTLIRFCGMSEPFLNPECADMIVYAKEHGFQVDCYSTLVGMDINDVDRVLDCVDDFVPHIPDKQGNAIIDVTDEYIKKLEKILEYKRDGKRLVKNISVHGEIDDRLKALIPDTIDTATGMQDRAGNLEGEALKVMSYEFNSPIRCEFCHNRLDSNVVLPNGDLLICCMDYGMEYVFGNILKEPYEIALNSEVATNVRNALIYGTQQTLCNHCMFAEELLT